MAGCAGCSGTRIEAALREAGLALVPDGAEGAFAVEGDTFPHRELIKRHGRAVERLAAPLAVRLRRSGGAARSRRRAPASLEEARATFQGWGSKHYHGHRERLRQRFLRGGVRRPWPTTSCSSCCCSSRSTDATPSPSRRRCCRAFGGLGGVLAAEPARYAECMGALPADAGAELRADPRRRSPLHPGAAEGDARAVAARAARRRCKRRDR